MRQICVALGLLGMFSATANAAIFTPTRFDDPAPGACLALDCSLREAVIAANATTASDTIQLRHGDYRLTQTSGGEAQSYDLDVTQALIIAAASGSPMILNAAAAITAESRVIDVHGTRLTLRGVSLRDGNVGSTQGGCLRAASATASFSTASIARCTAKDGSGISATGSNLSLSQAHVYRNAGSAVGLSASTLSLASSAIDQNTGNRGGGVYVFGNATSYINASGSSAISNNQASIGGGVMVEWDANAEIVGPASGWLGIMNNVADLGGGLLGGTGYVLLRNVDVSGNVADIGGGMHVTSVDLKRVHISNNLANSGGGAYVGCAGIQWPCRISETSFANNQASADGGALLHMSGGLLELINVSSYANSANRGGGVAAMGAVRLIHFTSYLDQANTGSSLVSIATPGAYTTSYLRNSALLGGCAVVGANVLISEGSNAQIAGSGDCSLTHATDKPAITAAQAGVSFADFGGGMPVVGIPAASILVNAALPSWCQALDVRGYPRSGSCDIGAFEVGAIAP